jgi:sterol desaturase/sphingolipid hydroxylase (fatty acid hydroxylase superfamily)
MFVLFEGDSYPAFGAGATFQLDWMLRILFRNMAATWIICATWDWFLYFSPLKDKLHRFKLNPDYPSFAQFKHDAFYTTLSSFFGSIVEILMCHGWATGMLPMQRNLSDAPITNIIMALTITHWRLPHFHFLHRMMHPWKTTTIPDVGKFLYRHVHSLHHKSYNPTAFSGTNMHPVEGTLYYTAGIIPIALGLHPIVALSGMVDCAVGAWLGHDGFQWPGSCDYYHLFHHQHFDCNYGSPLVPIDALFGTYAGCPEDISKIWGKQRAGRSGNEFPVHAASTSKDRVI